MNVNMSVISKLMLWPYFYALNKFEQVGMENHGIKSCCSFACGGQIKAEKGSVIFEHLLTPKLSKVRKRIELADVCIKIPCNYKWEVRRNDV